MSILSFFSINLGNLLFLVLRKIKNNAILIFNILFFIKIKRLEF